MEYIFLYRQRLLKKSANKQNRRRKEKNKESSTYTHSHQNSHSLTGTLTQKRAGGVGKKNWFYDSRTWITLFFQQHEAHIDSGSRLQKGGAALVLAPSPSLPGSGSGSGSGFGPDPVPLLVQTSSCGRPLFSFGSLWSNNLNPTFLLLHLHTQTVSIWLTRATKGHWGEVPSWMHGWWGLLCTVSWPYKCKQEHT